MKTNQVIVGLFLLVIGAVPVTAQTHEAASLRAQRRGMEVIHRGIEALGGFEAINGVKTVRLNAEINGLTLGQAAHPGAGGNPSGGPPVYLNQVRHVATGLRLYEFFASDTSSQPAQRVAYRDDGITLHQLGANVVAEVDKDFAETFLRQLAYVPDILLDAVERAATVRWIGEATHEGRSHDLVTFASGSGVQRMLFFDTQTGRLAKSEFVETHAQFGDHVADVSYSDYRRVGRLVLPHRLESHTAGRLSSQTEFTKVQFDVPWNEQLLEFPEDATPGPSVGATSTTASALTVTDLGGGVYLMPQTSGNYTTMFVAMDDYVIVLEASVSPDVSRAVMTKIHEVIPDKPIRYAAISHYHFDHSGGLWSYVADGVTIVTTAGNRKFVRQVAGAPRTLDGESAHAGEPKLEMVEGRRVFGSGAYRVEFYEVPNPHVDELLIAYIPRLELLFVADLYSFNGQVQPANAQTLALADRIEELGLEVETVVPVHGQQTTGENFWESVRLGRERRP